MTRRYCAALLADNTICGKLTTGTRLLCPSCLEARKPAPVKRRQWHRPRCRHPKRRLGFAYFSLSKGCDWFWSCPTCGSIQKADLPDDDDRLVIHVDPVTASLYGEPQV